MVCHPWWRGGVFYQIYPRSFCDSNGDGIGDLEGVRSRLDHLAWLGVDALWLSPVFPSPGADGGYDVSHYCDIDPVFGDIAAFDRLVAAAHARGLRVLLDWVPNHTSVQHPWFHSSRRDPDGPHANWYWWADKPLNNWSSAFGGPAWTYDEARGQYYLHLFTAAQPDLNWNEPGVQDAMFDTLRFWLDRGVDGFRADVVHLVGRDPALKDVAPRAEPGLNDLVNSYRDPRTHEVLRKVRGLLDSYPGERMMIGEVSLEESADVVTYLGTSEDPELHLAFDFSLLEAPWDAEVWRACIAGAEIAHAPVETSPTWVLSSHDASRHRTRYGGSEAAARVAAVLLLTLRGAAFLYAGEELGLQDATVGRERSRAPLGRDPSRAPIPWTIEEPHGWTGSQSWLPWPPDPGCHNPQALRRERGGILWLYRRLLELRRTTPALAHGDLELLDSPPGTLAYRRSLPRATETAVTVVANFASTHRLVPYDGAVLLESSAPDRRGALVQPSTRQLLLAPFTAAVMREPMPHRPG
ncbi:MAG: DUF3459 domain-containing protein [Nocardioidaceae bacterium]|nr:DUF3459 domain-containing protein [Nocardioidaceae bacterium]